MISHGLINSLRIGSQKIRSINLPKIGRKIWDNKGDIWIGYVTITSLCGGIYGLNEGFEFATSNFKYITSRADRDSIELKTLKLCANVFVIPIGFIVGGVFGGIGGVFSPIIIPSYLYLIITEQ